MVVREPFERNEETLKLHTCYRFVRNPVIVVILVASISLTVFVKVFLSRVGKTGTVILK